MVEGPDGGNGTLGGRDWIMGEGKGVKEVGYPNGTQIKTRQRVKEKGYGQLGMARN